MTGTFNLCVMMKMRYDKEEKSILDVYENGQLKLKTPSKKEIESIKAAANSTFTKSKRILNGHNDHNFEG